MSMTAALRFMARSSLRPAVRGPAFFPMRRGMCKEPEPGNALYVNTTPSPGTRKALQIRTADEQHALERQYAEEKKYGTSRNKFYTTALIGSITMGGILFGIWKTYGEDYVFNRKTYSSSDLITLPVAPLMESASSCGCGCGTEIPVSAVGDDAAVLLAGKVWNSMHVNDQKDGRAVDQSRDRLMYVDGEGKVHRDTNSSVSSCNMCSTKLTKTRRANCWGEAFCDKCTAGNKCYSCLRYISSGRKGAASPPAAGVMQTNSSQLRGVKYQDGRSMCTDCRGTCLDELDAVTDFASDVRMTLEGLGLELEYMPKLSLRDALTNTDKKSLPASHHDSQQQFRNQTDGMRGRVIKRESTITIVRGLPLLHVGQVVAHELAHAWLFESKVMESGLMARQEQEAFCDMASYLWLSAQLKKYEVEGDPSKIREASVRAQMFEKRLLTAKDGREFKALVKKIAALPQGNGLLTVAEDLRSKANAQFNA